MATDTGPYALHVPEPDDLADVPADIAALADDVTTALNGKLQRTDMTLPGGSVVKGADNLYQAQIKIVTAVPSSTAGYDEGTIIFVVP